MDNETLHTGNLFLGHGPQYTGAEDDDTENLKWI